MLAHLPVLLALLAAPEEDAAAKMRVAWASQYEWKEDGVRNITLEFEYNGSWAGRDEQGYSYRGTGQIVVVDGELVRLHLPAADRDRRPEIQAELDWVIARFVRKPFEEAFRDVKFGTPEELADGVLKIPFGREWYLVKSDRLVGREHDIGTPGKPFLVRTDFEPGVIGNAYGILEERTSYTRAMDKTLETRRLTLRKYDLPPSPQRHTYERESAAGKMRVEIVFSKPHVNAEDPVALDSAARDRLKAAWARLYRLPRDIRIEGSFQRKLDRSLARARWTPNVRGKFQVWGLDSIEVVVKGESGGERTQDTCLSHLRWAFGLFDVNPFDEEFKGCGFTLEEREKGEVIVNVVGHPGRLAFRIAGGLIIGHLETGAGQSWWAYKVKEARDQPVLIERMTVEVNGVQHDLDFRYGKVDGELVPKSVAALGIPTFTRSPNVVFGVAEYRFSRLKVSRPK